MSRSFVSVFATACLGGLACQQDSPEVASFAAALEALGRGSSARVIVNLRERQPTTAALSERLPPIAEAQSAVLAAMPADGFAVKRRYSRVAALAGVVSSAGLEALRAHPLVASVQLDEPTSAHLAESVPAIGADFVRSTYGYDGRGVVVAVLDSGVDTDHSDLAGDIVAQHCFTDNSCPPNGTSEGTSAEDENGHGTNVAGIITGDGVVASPGFVPAAKIVAVRVLGSDGTGWLSDWLAGLDWVLANQATLRASVVNMSLGTNQLFDANCDAAWPSLSDTLAQLAAEGVVVFASTGNQGSATSIAAPSCNSNVVAVGATYDSDLGREPDAGTYDDLFGGSWPACSDSSSTLSVITCFTNSSSQMDLVAPGAIITAAFVGGGTDYYRGTSQASPTAASVAVMLRQCEPSLSPTRIEQILETTGTLATDPKNGISFPRVDAKAAVDSACQCRPGHAVNGAACDDGIWCNGPDTCSEASCKVHAGRSCNDALSCTADSCDEAGAQCAHILQAGYCVIQGACVTQGTLNPTNPCQACDPAKSGTSWSSRPNGTTCDDGLWCSGTDSCSAGSCTEHAGRSCDDGVSCTADRCDEAGAECTHTLQAGYCLIDGACVAEGASEPANVCRACIPSASTAGWSHRAPGTTCDDGVWCNGSDSCSAGSCAQHAGHSCDDGVGCTTDSCDEAGDQCTHTLKARYCVIDAVCVAEGDLDPANACRACVPSASTIAWSDQPGSCAPASSADQAPGAQGRGCSATQRGSALLWILPFLALLRQRKNAHYPRDPSVGSSGLHTRLAATLAG